MVGNPENALALTKYAFDRSEEALPHLSDNENSSSPVRDIRVCQDDARFLHKVLQGEVQRCRALVDIAKLRSKAVQGSFPPSAAPLSDRLGVYPAEQLDLENIVEYPPRLQTIPVKPLFLDIAWNYIDYPSKKARSQAPSKEQPAPQSASQPEEKPQKRGWFGFGR